MKHFVTLFVASITRFHLNTIMIYEYTSIKDFLKAELERRLQKNTRYSLRTFARSLGVNAGELSLVLRGERSLSYNSTQKILSNLALSPNQQKYFIELLQAEKNGLSFSEINPSSKNNSISVERFEKISKWYHFAILNLMETTDFKWTPQHIAKRLGISQIEAGLAMQDLTLEGLVELKETTKKRGVTKTEVLQVSTILPSQVIRKYHAEILQKALLALEEVPKDLREYQSVGICCDTKDLQKIKDYLENHTNEFIEKFHRPLAKEVYQLQVCLLPLTLTRKDSL